MSFIKLYPLQEFERVSEEDFGYGNPARCKAERQFGARNIFLNIQQIAAFEECPLYLICEAETDALVNGIRIRLVSGATFVIPDDPQNEANNFTELLQRASHGEIVEMEYSRYLMELQKEKLI